MLCVRQFHGPCLHINLEPSASLDSRFCRYAFLLCMLVPAHTTIACSALLLLSNYIENSLIQLLTHPEACLGDLTRPKIGLRRGTNALCFASTRTPSTPTTLRPSRAAIARARRSSIRIKSAWSSTARAIASAYSRVQLPLQGTYDNIVLYRVGYNPLQALDLPKAPGSPGTPPMIS